MVLPTMQSQSLRTDLTCSFTKGSQTIPKRGSHWGTLSHHPLDAGFSRSQSNHPTRAIGWYPHGNLETPPGAALISRKMIFGATFERVVVRDGDLNPNSWRRSPGANDHGWLMAILDSPNGKLTVAIENPPFIVEVC